MITLDEIPFGEDNQKAESFTDGNAKDLNAWKETLDNKTKLIVHTIEPLVEISLVKLLGNNEDFDKTTSNITILDDGQSFGVYFLYTIKKWIAPDTDPEFIKKDANAIFDNLKQVPDVKKWQSCEIDVTKGTLKIEFLM